jgi:hypothetical protein
VKLFIQCDQVNELDDHTKRVRGIFDGVQTSVDHVLFNLPMLCCAGPFDADESEILNIEHYR